MEKPAGVIQKIIESLQQINALDTYTPIEKDIILHNLRAAYMIFMNISTETEHQTRAESRVEQLFAESGMQKVESDEEQSKATDEIEIEEIEPDEIKHDEIVPEESDEEEIEIEESDDEQSPSNFEGVPEGRGSIYIDELETVIEEPIEEEPVVEEEEIIEEEIVEEPVIEEEPVVEEEVIEEVQDTFQSVELQDDLLEFIPDARPHSDLLFDDLEMPKPEKKSLNDLLEKKDDNSLGAKFQQSFIPDLTKAIGINEKFSFIRELFHNSGVDFSNAIQKLNECENIDAAFILMEELKHQYVWDTTSSAYLSLCDLVRRRFI